MRLLFQKGAKFLSNTLGRARLDPPSIALFMEPVLECYHFGSLLYRRLVACPALEPNACFTEGLASLQFVEEHRLVFQLNNSIIRTFPISIGATVTGCFKLLPIEVVLIGFSTLIALIMVWYTRAWIVTAPGTEEFADPDFVAQ